MFKTYMFILIACFFVSKDVSHLTIESLLSVSGTLPKSLFSNHIASNVLTTFFNFEPISLSLTLLTLILTHRLLHSNDMSFELPTLIIGSTLLHGAVVHYLSLPSVGSVSITASCVAFSLIHSIKLHSLRTGRNILLAGIGSIILSPHTSIISVLSGIIVGYFVSIITKREESLFHLSMQPPNNLVRIAPAQKQETVDEILKKYTQRSA